MKILLPLILFLLSGCTILGKTWENYERQQKDKMYGRGYIKCVTKKDPWGRIVTECR